MLAQILIAVSAGILLALGIGHLFITFVGPMLMPRDRSLRAAMTGVPLVISRRTDMWRAWIGFNATHSFALILFGLVYGHLAITRADVLFDDPVLLAVGFATLAGLLVLARLYFFAGPVLGVSIALGCYLAGIAVDWSQPG